MNILEYKALSDGEKIEVAKKISIHTIYDFQTIKHTLDKAVLAYECLFDWRQLPVVIGHAEFYLSNVDNP